MNVLITGGAGFLGGHLVDACVERGDNVRVIVRKTSDLTHLSTLSDKIEIIYGDLTDPLVTATITKDIDIIFHSAARVVDFGSYTQFVSTNITATEYLLGSAQAHGVQKFIFVSSPSVVAEDRDQLNIDESYPLPTKFLNYYSETKARAEQLVLKANAPGFMTCAIRPRGIWGPRDKSGFIPKVLANLKAGKMKNLAGNKTVLASLCHVENAVHACLLAGLSNNTGGKAYFITDGENNDLWRLIDRLAQQYNLPPVKENINPIVLKSLVNICELIWMFPWPKNSYSPPVSRYKVGLITNSSTYNINRAKQDFGYVPRVDLNEGLEKLKQWVENNGGLDSFINQP